jgi:ABC-type phosphate/phosphonate transport system substrate-binding protein
MNLQFLFFLPFLFFLSFFPFACQSHASEQTLPDTLRVGYSAKLLGDADARDAQVAMDLWARELNRFVGVRTFPKSIIFADLPSMFEAIQKRQVDMISLQALDFLRFKDRVPLEPVFVSANQADGRQERVFLVRKEKAPTKMDSLKNKTLALQSRSKDEVTHLWLETLLAREGIPDPQEFFGQVKEVTKGSQAVMPVFFRQVDAAIVARSTFETMSLLNPQIGGDLTVIAHSKSLLGNISCFHRDLAENLKKIIIAKAPTLHESPNLKQMFIFFQSDRFILFQPSHLHNLAELWREYQDIRKKSSARR